MTFTHTSRSLVAAGLVSVLVNLIVAGGCSEADPSPSTPVAATPERPEPAPPPAPESPAKPRGAVSLVPAAPPTMRTTPASPAPGAPGAEAAPVAGPQITFDRDLHNFGRFLENEVRSTKIGFANTGTERLYIRSVQTSCGCTVARPSRPQFEPGERGELEVRFDPTGPGQQRKYVNIMTNAEPPLSKIVIEANVLPFVEIEPRMIQFGTIPYHKGSATRVRVQCDDEDFTIDSVVATNEHMRARVMSPEETASEPGAHPESGAVRFVELTVDADAPWGGEYGWLEIGTTRRIEPGADPISYTSRLRVAAEVFGSLQASPNTFRFGGPPGLSFEREITLSRISGEPFTASVLSFEASTLVDPTVEIRPGASPNTYTIVLSAGTGSSAGAHKGVVRVQTDVPGEELLEIPIVGLTRRQPGGLR